MAWSPSAVARARARLDLDESPRVLVSLICTWPGQVLAAEADRHLRGCSCQVIWTSENQQPSSPLRLAAPHD
jgi:hypothetical protein